MAKDRAIAALRLIVGRAAYVLTLWIGVIVLAFALFHLAPTDPARVALGAHATEEQVASFRAHCSDQPVPSNSAIRFGTGTTRPGRIVCRPSPGRARGRHPARRDTAVGRYRERAHPALDGSVVPVGLGRVAGRALRSVEFLFLSLPTLFSGVIIALATVQFYPFTRFAATGGASDLLFFRPPWSWRCTRRVRWVEIVNSSTRVDAVGHGARGARPRACGFEPALAVPRPTRRYR